MSTEKKVALITGCSSGGLGAALAIALHKLNYRVVATARNTGKLQETDAFGIEHLELDVLSNVSIAQCVKSLEALTGRLDLLINNAGAGHNMPVVDIDVDAARKVYDLNVFSLITVTRAFLPLLLKSPDAKIANNISVAAYINVPVMSVYHSSKAAANSITDSLRMELSPFGVKVVALITGAVKSNFFHNLKSGEADATVLPEDSIYRVVPGGLSIMRDSGSILAKDSNMDAQTWAKGVTADLAKSSPPHQIWRGSGTGMMRVMCHAPIGIFDGMVNQATKFDEVEKALKNAK